MDVVSLFDGISCGMIALERAGIKVDSYTAYEIDKYAIEISKKNYPDIIRPENGDVFCADWNEYKKTRTPNTDLLLIGGSPCTHWSIANANREVTCSGIGYDLFMQYARALHELKPKYFLYENNYRIHKDIVDAISKELGVKPIMIDSALVSAQSRKRYYWTNIPNVTQPTDKGILLKDVIESGTVDRDKSLCVIRRYAGFSGSQSMLCRRYFGKSFGQAIFEGNISSIKQMWKENPHFISLDHNIRQMSVLECERLQTLPDGYTDAISSKKRRYEAIGNGWTVDVIAHILKSIPTESS